MARSIFYIIAICSLITILLLQLVWPKAYWLFLLWLPYTLRGIKDLLSHNNILRNYPVIGHLRYFFEFIRPEIQQYFIASNLSGRPFNREQRSLVYQRAKQVIDTMPFGSQQDITEPGYLYAYHSLNPQKLAEEEQYVIIGGDDCQQPYKASRLNISAMSYGALGSRAIQALNIGAKQGGFAHNTGEGGLSHYHLQHGGDLIWQIGTAYFGCRTVDGKFDAEKFKQGAQQPQVKMIEIKLSQGAKPSHGGILPAEKVSAEIAAIRGIEAGKTCLSPAKHSAFDSPKSLLDFVKQLRELSGGKPVGFKLCIGLRYQFMAICKAMLETNILPDFITVDGAEGGTGAAPVEFINRLGTPINESIAFVHSCLRGVGLRNKIKIIASGKVVTGFDMVTKIALGADACNSARPMMFALGCIQALRCNDNTCPTGVTTSNDRLQKALLIDNKAKRVSSYHQATIASFVEMAEAMGITNIKQLNASHILQRDHQGQEKPLSKVYTFIVDNQLVTNSIPADFADDWAKADSGDFG